MVFVSGRPKCPKHLAHLARGMLSGQLTHLAHLAHLAFHRVLRCFGDLAHLGNHLAYHLAHLAKQAANHLASVLASGRLSPFTTYQSPQVGQ